MSPRRPGCTICYGIPPESDMITDPMMPDVIEVSPGGDILQSLSCYVTENRRAVCILSGVGTVRDITLLRPPGGGGIAGTVTMHGLFKILHLSGGVLLPPPEPTALPAAGWLTTVLSDCGGRVVGGTLIGPLVASGEVTLAVLTFASMGLDRLPFGGETGGFVGQVLRLATSAGCSTGDGSGILSGMGWEVGDVSISN